jgi:hypothetical protein
LRRRRSMNKWNQVEDGNVHVSDGQEGFWGTFRDGVTAAEALAEYMSTADYSESTASFVVTATVLSGVNEGDMATTTHDPEQA